MRIISGKHKGRKIELLKEAGGKVRPTSEFAREAVFNILSHGKLSADGYGFVGKNVLDVFCGTGAFGLEALSRGAASVTFVDSSREAIASARYNAQQMNELDNTEFLQLNATKLGRARKVYSLIFIDPPYFEKLIPPTLIALHGGEWVAADSLIVIEHDSKESIEIPPMFEIIDQRKYGRATIEVLKLI
ncbi:MAG: 16S rRNA (guanine(966)-N(2))-methyltransferase RsmD [Rickettsiales bacterium]